MNPGTGAPPLRVGDAERDAAIAALSDHFAAGRLRADEFDERMSAALLARTAADLAKLFVDLPRLFVDLPQLFVDLPRATPVRAPRPQPSSPPALPAVGLPTVSPTHALTACLMALATGGYFLPWAVAALRNRPDTKALAACNLLFGWTGVGWILTLVLACLLDQPATPPAPRTLSWSPAVGYAGPSTYFGPEVPRPGRPNWGGPQAGR